MAREKRVIDGKEVDVNVETVDGKEVVTVIKEQKTLPKGEVTQEAIDRIWKQLKETEEKSDVEIKKLVDQLQMSEEGKVELVERIKALETPPAAPGAEEPKTYGSQADGSTVYPQTEEEWDDLIAERPAFGTDLRTQYKTEVGGRAKEIQGAQLTSALKVANELLPDMYKKDAEGKTLLDKGGHPVPDDKSELFKIYCQVASEEGVDGQGNPVIFSTKNGPELIALKVKASLGTDRETELKKKAEDERLAAEGKRNQVVKDGKTAPPGHEPPPLAKVEVTFGTDYERQHAEKKVASGVYKNLEEYCRIRDNKAVPYGRGNV